MRFILTAQVKQRQIEMNQVPQNEDSRLAFALDEVILQKLEELPTSMILTPKKENLK